MDSNDRQTERDGRRQAQEDLRDRVSKVLGSRAAFIIADAVAILPYTASETLDHQYCTRLGESLVRVLAFTVREGTVDPRGALIANLRTVVLERALAIEQLFAFAYLTERTALDELALDASIGATTEVWPLVAQLVRRGSFEYLASFVARTASEATDADLTDRLTTLHTRRVFDAVLIKETERSGRFGYALALILFDVDHLSAINERHGYGVGNKILERVGILMRKYFRRHDWVARYGEDEIAVLLTASDAEHAGELAERARMMVEERLTFTDHHTDTLEPVTLTAAVVNVPAAADAAIDPELLLIEAESALTRAKLAGGNRVELATGSSTTRAPLRNSPLI